MSRLRTADHWRKLAEAARADAAMMHSVEARRTLEEIAKTYERLAEWIDKNQKPD